MALALEIVTPEQRVLSVQADEVRLPGSEGGFGVRPGHTPLVAALKAGELVYLTGGAPHRYAVGEGFAEVSDDRVRVLVEEACDFGRGSLLGEPAQLRFKALLRRDGVFKIAIAGEPCSYRYAIGAVWRSRACSHNQSISSRRAGEGVLRFGCTR